MKYFIKDLGIGHGAFVKQDSPLVKSIVNGVESKRQYDCECWGSSHCSKYIERQHGSL